MLGHPHAKGIAMRRALDPELRYPALLLALYAAIWVGLGIAPSYREDWLLENVIVLIAVPLLVVNHRRLRLSNLSCSLLFVFLVLHAIGAHYTYSEVPLDRWSEALFGQGLSELFGFQRNHYDRLVHFMYGLLVTPAMIELLDARAPQRGMWRWLLPWFFVLAHSARYEILEWLAAEVFGGELGQAYLGTQGDVWDAQKDSALAALGALIAVFAVRGARRAQHRR